ncbi:helix-turn-helix domain-containing protein [Exiguobacterium sp. 17-1]|uniref:winged helix-turn-helix transcriptional regulator n=1 Tax=Exiguobacterium sp. 17-1 TaxID=2931981 RepID=UPI001FFF50FC|nr:helix-turn-helix domain-containing protein [Exiguobacterium sp. 17-1]MCK2159076.1 MarR family transcriptional regulator [Exiguobacterium sp. 17-1]
MSKKVDFTEAERNARLRDFENQKEDFKEKHNGIDEQELEKALNTLNQATAGKNVYVATKRSTQSKIKFAQFIQDNWNYALENSYFTDEEMLFLLRIQRFLQFKSNCIVDDIHSRSAVPMTQKQIAERLNTYSSQVSKIVKSLTNKGIIVKAEGHKKEGVNARTYALFLNPNLIYSGERDNVEVTLKTLFIQEKIKLKDFPVALF